MRRQRHSHSDLPGSTEERYGSVGVWERSDCGLRIADCRLFFEDVSIHQSKIQYKAKPTGEVKSKVQNQSSPTPPHPHTPTQNTQVRTKGGRLFAYNLLLVALLALTLSACEEDVVAVLGTELPFSMFGVLMPQADTQWVRVFPIEGRLEPAPPGLLDARFTSTDLQTGERRVWNDSLIQEANGQYAHVFWSSFLTPFERAYRLEVERSDGAVSHVEVVVPPFAELEMPARTNLAPTLLPVFVRGEVPNLIRIEVIYRYRYRTPLGIEAGEATVSYEGKARRIEGGWAIDVTPQGDLRSIQRLIEQNIRVDPEIGLKLAKMTLRLIAANAEWDPPGATFDADVLVQPGTLSNVENGFGFVGAGYRLLGTWVPLDTIIVGDTHFGF